MNKKTTLVLQTLTLLKREGFNVSAAERYISCFDLIASKGSFVLIIKLLFNIDGFSKEQATDMKNLSNLFSAYPLIIGKKTRHLYLQDSVLYSRYGINAVTENSFDDIISLDAYPAVLSSRGGYYVKIDGEKLRRLREERNISSGELADCVGVSRTMVYSYENSGFGATLNTIVKMEEYLDETLALPFEVFSIPPQKEHTFELGEEERYVFSRLEGIGFDIHPVKRAPFEAVTKVNDDFMLTKIDNVGKKALTVIKIIKEFSDIASCSAFIVSGSPNAKENVDGVPIIKNSELENMENRVEFLEVLEERR